MDCVSALQTGKVTEIVKDMHKSSDFIDFLNKLDAGNPTTQTLGLILDNHSVHTYLNFAEHCDESCASFYRDSAKRRNGSPDGAPLIGTDHSQVTRTRPRRAARPFRPIVLAVLQDFTSATLSRELYSTTTMGR